MKSGILMGLPRSVGAALLLLSAGHSRADLAVEYLDAVQPLLSTKCYDCHSSEFAKADLNLERFADLESVQAEPELWQHVLERVQAYEMPPKKSGELDYNQFQTLVGFLRRLPKPEEPDCNQLASDRTASYYRGYVMSRRLNRAEYVNTVRDLFGVAFGNFLVELLPADGGGGEGFDTTGDTLFTSPIHIERYLAAAEWVTQQVLPDDDRGQEPEWRAARDRILFRGQVAPEDVEASAREMIGGFARRAWRRPLAGDELESLMGLFGRATNQPVLGYEGWLIFPWRADSPIFSGLPCRTRSCSAWLSGESFRIHRFTRTNCVGCWTIPKRRRWASVLRCSGSSWIGWEATSSPMPGCIRSSTPGWARP